MKLLQFPFSAIVNQEAMKTALILNAVDPTIGGVLIRGHKGTGKSTAARSLTQLLPGIEVVENCPFNSDPRSPLDWNGVAIDGRRRGRKAMKAIPRAMPFVELPLNATEDRLAGSLHIERALQTGRRSFEPGLLAAANRGILYVDEVNLLDDHLVDMLLDVAASGINIIEREGISFVHPARFILIGTMNPEEGELRPQFLDRFGLCAAVQAVSDPASRETIVRRRLAFESDPAGFSRQWEQDDGLISDQIVRARACLEQIVMPESMLNRAVRLAQDLHVQGHRADITILKAARAHAALMERRRIGEEDVAEAARLAAPHRMKSTPLDSMESLLEKIEIVLREAGRNARTPEKLEDPPPEQTPDEMAEQIQVPGSMAAGSILFSFLVQKKKERVFEPDPSIGSAGIEIGRILDGGAGLQGKSKGGTIARRGRYRRAANVQAGERGYDIALDATLRQAALRRAREGVRPDIAFGVKSEDLRKKQHARACEHLIVFVVDASDSMGEGAETRMRAAKGAVLAILRKAYQNRSKVAMVAFGGEEARVVLPPTSSIDTARRRLEHLPTGGATPFADGMFRAWRIVRSERLKNPGVRPILAIISDGEANVPISAGASPIAELSALAERIGHDAIAAVFIDAAAMAGKRSGMRQIALRMGASYLTVRDLTTPRLLKAVRSAGQAH